MTEEQMRELLGYGSRPEITFAGQQWEIAADGLAALLRYSRATLVAQLENDQSAMSALYGFLEDVVIRFGEFTEAALVAKTDMEEVVAASRSAVEFYCCRSYWPAMRLISVIAQDAGEVDGNLLRQGGRGLTSLTAREACNLALAVCLDGRNEEDRAIFMEDLTYEGNPEAEALAAVRAMQAERAAAGG